MIDEIEAHDLHSWLSDNADDLQIKLFREPLDLKNALENETPDILGFSMLSHLARKKQWMKL